MLAMFQQMFTQFKDDILKQVDTKVASVPEMAPSTDSGFAPSVSKRQSSRDSHDTSLKQSRKKTPTPSASGSGTGSGSGSSSTGTSSSATPSQTTTPFGSDSEDDFEPIKGQVHG